MNIYKIFRWSFILALLGNVLFSCSKADDKRLKPLSSEEIFHKNQDAVVLIKHSFVYVIELLGERYYFKDYNPVTGEISDLISYEEAKADPNTSWGTGFFIKEDGSILTNRHVVRVNPSEEDQNKIALAIKNKFIEIASVISIKLKELQDDLYNYETQLYYTDYNTYQYDILWQKIQELRDQKADVIKELNDIEKVIDTFGKYNKVSKTSFQFGIFLNNQIVNRNLDNYIKYKSVKVSDKEEVDLALLEPVNSNDIIGKKIVVADMSKVDSVSIISPKVTQKVIMIGYNYGEELANTRTGIKPQITEGNISQNTDVYTMLYTIPALSGSSGSPVFDIYGRVIAVNFAGIRGTQSFNFGIQTQQIKDFLKDY